MSSKVTPADIAAAKKGSWIMSDNMIYGLFLSESFSDKKLKEVLGSILHVNSSDIVVVEDIAELGEAVDVIVERDSRGGEFPCFLTVYVSVPVAKTELDVACELSREFECDALYPGDSDNPYLFELIQPNLKVSTVLLKDDPLDERGEAVLCKGDDIVL